LFFSTPPLFYFTLLIEYIPSQSPCKSDRISLFLDTRKPIWDFSLEKKQRKMDVLASECSSGCDSGWTLYLEQSFLSPNSGFINGKNGFCDDCKDKRSVEDAEEEEEDLSMVSDASSGPPHLPEDQGYFNDDNGCFYSASKSATLAKNVGKRQKIKEHRRREDQEPTAFLDDTASSPVINLSGVSSHK